MARMVPPYIDPDRNPSPGELAAFERLRDDDSIEDWVVLHSLNLAEHRRKVKSEADFVILMPGLGILCLEVKAHRKVAMREGLWHLGSERPRLESPFEQSQGAARSVIDHFRKSPSLSSIYVAYGVLFTHANFDQASIEWSQWEFADRRAFNSRSMAQICTSIFKSSLKHAQDRHRRIGSDLFTPDLLQKALGQLRGDFETVLSPKQIRSEREQEVLRLTEEQLEAIDYFEQAPQVLFAGSAGTGKTVLALECARREVMRGARPLVLCFNNLLAGSLKASLEPHGDGFVGTAHRYMLELAGEADSAGDVVVFEGLADRALEAALGASEQYDVLIVDEAQDLLRSDLLDIVDTSLVGGLSSGRWRLFGDFTGQAVHASLADITLDQFRSDYSPMFARFDLTKNCRNVPRVVDYVDRFAPIHDSVEILRRDNEIRPEQKMSKPADAPKQLGEFLEAARALGFAWSDIVILSPNDRSPTVNALRQSAPWTSRIADYWARSGEQIGFTTIRKFKGLDSPAVVLVDIGEIASPAAQSLLYVGLTRARDGLWLLLDPSCQPDIERILF